MSFKVQVGPPQIAIHQGQTVLVSEPNGRIDCQPKVEMSPVSPKLECPLWGSDVRGWVTLGSAPSTSAVASERYPRP